MLDGVALNTNSLMANEEDYRYFRKLTEGYEVDDLDLSSGLPVSQQAPIRRNNTMCLKLGKENRSTESSLENASVPQSPKFVLKASHQQHGFESSWRMFKTIRQVQDGQQNILLRNGPKIPILPARNSTFIITDDTLGISNCDWTCPV